MELKKQARTFMTEGLVIDSWETIKKYFVDLSEREIHSSEDLGKWLQDRSELDAVLEEDAAWRYIRMTIDTRDESLSNAYTFFVTKIQPELAPYDDILNRKLVDCQFTNELKSDPAYAIYFKAVETALEIFREENIPLEAELNEKSQLFGSISAAQSIEHEGAQITMQKASALLKETDESLRRTVFDKMSVRRREDTQKLHDLFTELIEKRHHLSVNAGFENFRDYKFKALNRFDYTKEDCFNFHQSVKDLIVPIVREIQQERLSKLGKNAFKPWDTEVDPEGKAPLKPFENGDEMLTGTIAMFHQIDTYFGECLEKMDEMGHLDLDSKAGKAPGGYN
ncbi:MAG: M3 family oligoendopeptidase, partial [Flavobacteriia bacterium]